MGITTNHIDHSRPFSHGFVMKFVTTPIRCHRDDKGAPLEVSYQQYPTKLKVIEWKNIAFYPTSLVFSDLPLFSLIYVAKTLSMNLKFSYIVRISPNGTNIDGGARERGWCNLRRKGKMSTQPSPLPHQACFSECKTTVLLLNRRKTKFMTIGRQSPFLTYGRRSKKKCNWKTISMYYLML